MKKNLEFFIVVDIIFLAVSVWFFIVSGLFQIDSETNLWFAITYVFTILCVAIFIPSIGFLSAEQLILKDMENEKILRLLSGVFFLLAAYSAICYAGDTKSLWAFFLIFTQLVASFILIVIIELLMGSLLNIGKLFQYKFSRVY